MEQTEHDKAPLHAKQKVHFVGLTGIRFILALFVCIGHLELFKDIVGINNYYRTPFINDVGNEMVTCFFALSGFLITYLLLDEKEKTNTIHVSSFYLRRILRIWPLYFLIIGVGLFVLPNVPEMVGYFQDGAIDPNYGLTHILLFLFILPNFARFVPHTPLFPIHTWSIGVEEQFYLLWPVIVKITRNYLAVFVSIIAFFTAAKAISVWGLPHLSLSSEWLTRADLIINFMNLTRIDCMAIGALSALWMKMYSAKYFRWLSHPVVLVSAFILFMIPFFTGSHYYLLDRIYVYQDFKATCFSLVLLGILNKPKIFGFLDAAPMRYLGNISYGLYMYHAPVEFCYLVFLKSIVGVSHLTVFENILLQGSSVFLIILVSAASYRYFETPFLRIKTRFQVIKSEG